MTNIRRVIHDPASRQDLDRLLSEAGWSVREENDGGPGPSSKVWGKPNHEGVLGYVEDNLFGCRYFTAIAADAEAIVAELEHKVRLLDLSEALDAFDHATSVDDIFTWTGCVAIIAARDFDVRIFQKIGALFVHPEPKARLGAILATTYLEWPEFIQPLQELAKLDPHKEVALRARLAVMILEGGQTQLRQP